MKEFGTRNPGFSARLGGNEPIIRFIIGATRSRGSGSKGSADRCILSHNRGVLSLKGSKLCSELLHREFGLSERVFRTLGLILANIVVVKIRKDCWIGSRADDRSSRESYQSEIVNR